MLNESEYKKGNIIVKYDEKKWSKKISKNSERNTIIALIFSLFISIVAASFIFVNVETDILHRIIFTFFSFIFILIYLAFQSFDANYLNKPIDFSLIEWLESLDNIQIYINADELMIEYIKENKRFNEHFDKQWSYEKLGCSNPKIIIKPNDEKTNMIIDLNVNPVNIIVTGKNCNNLIHFDKKI